ncbi:MAG: RNA-binding protein [Candidatus Aenigmarchaeota archaeon]|nr:RNA-binding protein [Candidatus Aenigmarchaeota archaeon]
MEENQELEQAKKERRLVIPGDHLGDEQAGHGTYVVEGKVYSKYIGLAEVRNGKHIVIPLAGVYSPKRGDGVIGKITDIIFQKWIVDINSPYEAVLPLSDAVEGFVDLTKEDLTRYFDYGDIIFAEISNVNRQKQVQLSMRSPKCRKLWGGRLIKVTPAKVPRIIGRQGSMVEMIKKLTGTQIVVGQNGIVWVRGDNEDLAAETVLTVERLSHKGGLTDYIKETLEKKVAELKPVKDEEKVEEAEENLEESGEEEL